MAQKEKMVHCRYPKCSKLHETTELREADAVKGGSRSYYHPDCYHVMQTINQIKETFYREVNPTLTGKQIGQLVSIANNMVFSKGIDVDLILFAIKYFVKYKQGKLKYPGGIAYIVQDRDVVSAWESEKQKKIRAEIREQQKNLGVNDDFVLDLPESKTVYRQQNKSKFSNVLGV
jgi:hypothetical protein